MQIAESWKQTVSKKAKQPKEGEACSKEEAETHVEEVQQYATEFTEILDQVHTCSLDNVIHAAKLKRLGDMHEARAKAIRMKLRGEVQKARRHKNCCSKHGVKNLSKTIGEQQAKCLMCVARDRDTEDGGKMG